MRLRAAAWTGGRRGTAVVFPGRTEYIEKYGRVVARLVARGLSVLVIDWRGQGLSDRHPPSPMLGHVDDFRDYQRDVAALMALAETLDLPAPRYLVAHSMGGCIGLRTLLERADFCGAVLSAPMWHLQMRGATRELTSKVTRSRSLVGLGARLTPGTSAQPTALAVGFEGNALTSDPEHFAHMVRQLTAHPELGARRPEHAVDLRRARGDGPALRRAAADAAGAGAARHRRDGGLDQRDPQPGGQDGAGTLILLEGARHEIFMERRIRPRAGVGRDRRLPGNGPGPARPRRRGQSLTSARISSAAA